MNKIWNASRFVILNLDKDVSYGAEIDPDLLDDIDKWILTKLNITFRNVNEHYNNYEYDKVASEIYHFIWDEYCDWYIELSKNVLYGDDEVRKKNKLEMLLNILNYSLKMLHPVSPYISEEIYQILSDNGYQGASEESILLEKAPEYHDSLEFEKEYKDFEYIKDIVVSIRNLRANIGVHPSDKIDIELIPENKETEDTVLKNILPIQLMSNTKEIKVLKEQSGNKSITSVIQGLEINLPVEGVIDLEKEIKRLEKDLAKLDNDLDKTLNKLRSKSFIEKAPEQVVQKEKSKQEEFEFQIKKINEILEKLRSI